MIFGLPFSFVVRALLERAFAAQEVKVNEQTLVWSRSTKIWRRKREVELSEIADVVADVPMLGEHGVRVVRRSGSRPRILERLSTESALATTAALKRYITVTPASQGM